MSAVELYNTLSAEWSKKSRNLKLCNQLLEKLKLELIRVSFLPTDAADALHSLDQLKLSRSMLEIAVEYSVVTKDLNAFERYISQLKCYYYDYAKTIGESEHKYKLLGLNLLYLLSNNRVSDFHTELELLSVPAIQNDKYIHPILELEQYIMEGRYNKIFQAHSSMPADIYNHFMALLIDTVRDEIAACIEKSYEQISPNDAAKRLSLRVPNEIQTFGAKREWTLDTNGMYNFTEKSVKPKESLPSVDLAEQVITYARELEMIV